MRVSGIGIAFMVLAIVSFASAQQAPLPADSMQMSCGHALLWTEGTARVVELRGLTSIELDHTRLTADNAVVWITPSAGGLGDEQRVRIALIGNARLEQGQIVRMDDKLMVTATISGAIRLVGERSGGRDDSSDIYRAAAELNASTVAAPAAPGESHAAMD